MLLKRESVRQIPRLSFVKHLDSRVDRDKTTTRIHNAPSSVRQFMQRENPLFRLGIAWIAMCLAFAAHIVDEAATGFLAVYNPTVLEARRRAQWFPMPALDFKTWLFGLIAVVMVLLLLSPFAFRGSRALRPLAYVFALIMLLNAFGHTLATIAG